MRLCRRFGCPPLDPGRQVLLLLLEQVPGLHSIKLNDREIQDVSTERSSYEIPLDALLPRNALVLEVDPRLVERPKDSESFDWGCICLLVQTRQPGEISVEPL
jgi:hypothetical protein